MKSKLLIGIFPFLFLILIVSACSLNSASTVTPVNDSRICNFYPNNFHWEQPQKRLFFIVVDGSIEFKENIPSVFTVLSNKLPKIVEPGDRIVLSWNEASNLNTSIFLDIQVEPIPELVIIPYPVLTTQTTTQETPQPTLRTRLDKIGDSNRKTQEALEATKSANSFNCLTEEFFNKQRYELDRFENNRVTAIKKFSEKFSSLLNGIEGGIFDKRSHVFLSLDTAANFLSRECHSEEEECDTILILFSELYDLGEPPNIDLSNIYTFVVLWDCRYFHDGTPQCDFRLSRWEEVLNSYNPQKLVFIEGADAETKLEENLSRSKENGFVDIHH